MWFNDIKNMTGLQSLVKQQILYKILTTTLSSSSSSVSHQQSHYIIFLHSTAPTLSSSSVVEHEHYYFPNYYAWNDIHWIVQPARKDEGSGLME